MWEIANVQILYNSFEDFVFIFHVPYIDDRADSTGKTHTNKSGLNYKSGKY